jgi:hypothetical protein
MSKKFKIYNNTNIIINNTLKLNDIKTILSLNDELTSNSFLTLTKIIKDLNEDNIDYTEIFTRWTPCAVKIFFNINSNNNFTTLNELSYVNKTIWKRILGNSSIDINTINTNTDKNILLIYHELTKYVEINPGTIDGDDIFLPASVLLNISSNLQSLYQNLLLNQI